jgi:hypothetical protein
MKNDSYIHDIMGNHPNVPKTTLPGMRGQSCDVSDGVTRSASRHAIYKNKRNDSTFNVISGEDNLQVPGTFSKRVFPEKEENRMNPILQSIENVA